MQKIAQKRENSWELKGYGRFDCNTMSNILIRNHRLKDVHQLLNRCFITKYFCFAVDYSKLPRSSGDGMEFSSSNSSDGTSSEGSNDNEISQRKNSSLAAVSVQGQTLGNQIVGTSAEVRITTQLKSYDCKQGNTNAQNIENQQKRTPYGYPLTPVILRTENAQSVSDEPAKAVTIQRQNSTNLLLQGPELPRINSQLGLSLNNDDQFVSLALPATDLNFGERPVKSTVVEHTAEFVNSQKVINDLEEQNSKLVEEKTKLSVQLGVQTKVWNH